MGNQLVAFAPSLIRPVEHYLTNDAPEYIFDINLGSTRFLKVCRARHGDLLCVVKVFVIHEHTIPISVYCERLVNLRNSLYSSPSPNCLPFTQVKANDRSVIVVRPYVKYSLYDRMSTRPFIQWSEKLWIAFQLLCGLAQVHKHGLCHGDLKLENILITPGLRVLLCDFAPFKPVYLPRNNPSAIFGFFFDTAGRRCCYVAPERFHDDKSRLGGDNLLMQNEELRHFLLPSMDIFSAGCCLIELFTEGRVPFDLSQLLSFCAGNYEPTSVISLVDDPRARELLSHMIQRDPSSRSSAEEYLRAFRGSLFPDVLYSTLQSYFDIIAFQPLAKPDSRMCRLHTDIKTLPKDPCVSLMFVSLVVAEIRGLTTTDGKLLALESLRLLSEDLSGDSILERVVPYLVHLLHDKGSARVRANALLTLVDVLDLVTNIPPSDYNIFSGFIFPAFERLDRDVAVRMAMANNIARIAHISMRYLEASFINESGVVRAEGPQFAAEFQSQRESVGGIVGALLTDSDGGVKRVLVSVPNSLEVLCSYFGRAKAHDLLLSHLITFLNDKEDSELRAAFFRSVPRLAAFIGSHAAPLLIPLLKQGLSDVEEFVMRESLLAIKSLAEIDFFGRRFLLELLDEVLPFVIHPNVWLRLSCAGVLAAFKCNLSEVDVHCQLLPRLRPFLSPTAPLSALNEVSILSKVSIPIERQVYETAARANENLLQATIQFFSTDHKNISPESVEIRNFLLRLRAEGLPETVDSAFVTFLHRHVKKVNIGRSLRAGGWNSRPNGTIKIEPSLVLSPREFSYSGLNYDFNTPTPNRGTITGAINFNERPRGILVAHLHEHRGPILKMATLGSFKGLFATASRDDVRVWDAEKMEGRNVANRSRAIIRLPGEKQVRNIASPPGSNLIGVLDDKNITTFALENMVARWLISVPLNSSSNPDEDLGAPIAFESFAQNLFLVGTELGGILGFDVRCPYKEVLRLQSDLKWGLMTGLCCDEDRHWICSGTSKGILTCWDLRFSIPVNTIKTDVCVRRLKASPMHPWGVFTSSRGLNELSLWNLETGSRHLCLWASPSPPLSKTSGDKGSVMSFTFIPSLNGVVSGGSDMVIRWWDLENPSNSARLVSPEKGENWSREGKSPEFRFRLVDGVEVHQEMTEGYGGGSPRSGGDSTPGPQNAFHGHHNSICEVGVVGTPNQAFVLSASTDGVIKVWK